MMENRAIRKVILSDIVQLKKIVKQTFYETFSSGNTEENMQKYLRENFSIERLTSEINDNNAAFYFAILDNQIVGYLKLNFGNAQTELQHANALEIERIYVLSDFQRKAVGQTLYERAVQIALKLKVDYIWLGVWEENQRAITFYKKNGFVSFGKHIFKLGNDEQTDIMMKLKLKTNKKTNNGRL